MPGTHAKLSASSALRWINCPPSAALTADMPETESTYASEGTLAHSLAEFKLRMKFEKISKSAREKSLTEIKADPLYQKEMDGHTDTYLDYVLKIAHGYNKVKPYVAIEKKLDYSHIAPEGFGTSDCVMLCKNDLHIIDFKYGHTNGIDKGGTPVSAEGNPQLKLYALGAINEYSMLYDIQNVTLHIIQPRLEDGISSWSISAADLLAWGESIKPVAELAYTGGGEYRAGGWCRFCKAKASCRARAASLLSLETTVNTPPELLTNKELGEVLSKAQIIKNWVNDVEEYALAEILKGNPVDGWKAVEGRSNRKITDTDAAFGILIQNGIDEALLYERKPITLTALEKLVPKGDLKTLIGTYIEKPKGKPTLAEASDKREEYKNYDLKEIFGGNEDE